MTGSLRYRIGVAARAVAAVVGGYAVAALASAVLALLLPMARPDAVLVGSLASFALFACAVLWVFAASSAARAWAGLAVVASPLALLLWALLARTAGGAA